MSDRITILTAKEEILRKLIRGTEIEEREEAVLDEVVNNAEQDFVTFYRGIQKQIKDIHWALENYSMARIDSVETLVEDPIDFDPRIFQLEDKTPHLKYFADLKILIYNLANAVKEIQIGLRSFQANQRLSAIYVQHLKDKVDDLSTQNTSMKEEFSKQQEQLDAGRREREEAERRSTEQRERDAGDDSLGV